MADDEKAKLYKRLVSSASEWQVLERMRVNGFWPWSQGIPGDPPAESKERAQIEAELTKLRATASAVQDPDKALEAERKRRWEESKKRRKEAKAKRAAEAKARREAWAKHRRATVVHLGAGVSGGLQSTGGDGATLRARGLPVMASSQDVAMMLGVSLGQLRWLTFHRRGATLVHYHRYEIPKKTGGRRGISAPKPKLSAAQHWVLRNVLDALATSPAAHGFVRHRSVVTNATPHVGRRVVVNLDLKDFFPTVTFRRVKGLFAKLGYNEHVATVLALLCTEPPRVVEVLGVALCPRHATGEPTLVSLAAPQTRRHHLHPTRRTRQRLRGAGCSPL